MDRIERYFDIAIKSPDGIKKLREMILSLAMQGKLVPQDPNDPPASELLKEIEVEKKKLIKEGKIKKQEPLPPIKPEDVPYALPTGWEWVRLGEIGNTNIGLTYAPKDISDTGTPVLRSNNIQQGKLDLNNLIRVNKSINENLHVQQGDILICARNGSRALVGKAAQIKELPEKMAFGAFMAIFRSRLNDYVEVFLNSPIFRKVLDEVSTTTINQITQNNLKNSMIPFPPLAEQNRIVARVDALMALCDKLEAERDARNAKRVAVQKTALDRLLAAQDQAAFDSAWAFIARNFADLYSVPENVAELKKAILQLAVMGKLVPQDTNDPPASELLKEIETEKKKLIKAGKIKKQEPLPPIKPEEVPYALPAGWEWVRLGEISNKITDGTHHSPPNADVGQYKYITAKNIKNDGIDFSSITFVTEDVHREIYNRCNPEKGDILYIKDGATTGVVTINDLEEEFSMLSSVALIKLPQGVLHTFLIKVMRSPLFYESIRNDMSGVAITRVTLSKIYSVLIPLPPLAEQKRIVAKVDAIMTLCDALEQQLKDATDKQTAILNAVVAAM